ncbi:3-deoxy-7-phosphoheptulonate synthase [Enterococcus sp. MJM12]|uniref:Phospho-2-dehydro-3-deoxyheptonate aldolase n=1 Tax=Candidatus Enterococcus myersii TaxID=2815322 RepID=A0ABS3H3Y6_9ENTE|nr:MULTISPECIES: 3-deoxy-7-phosphoheptulonate synthase [Enterococcus]MBO0448161.1 3-deoxy-7-phosphoheptulonate synthase [Enterococcus sp. MJM12]MCD1024669.1 3-deoxy-7-phosphoheptulonate synthase [Enterococcus sp. SMC-9]MDT2740315.1 3-deoxy-7-phosphoheptulonate synthase [Enterococcus canintestini]
MFKAISKKINAESVKSLAKLSEAEAAQKKARDLELEKIITGEDQRILLIIGPCSAHEEEAVMEYVHRLAKLQAEVADKVFMVPRIYTNKPRTNGDGYKGLLHQQNPNGESNLIRGIVSVRKLHKRVLTETGLTTADEMLYPENLEFVEDLVSYIAVGARSVEDQQHRFVASGINQPTGMKNPTSGNLTVLFNSLYAAQQKQEFIYNGAEVESSSNPLAHVVLRGGLNEVGKNIPNYHYEDLIEVTNRYEAGNFKNPFVVVDTNHDNSGKQYFEQIRIVKETLENRKYNQKIKKMVRGFMIESFIEDGRQEPDGTVFGQSITDPCLGWEKTEELVRYIAKHAE